MTRSPKPRSRRAFTHATAARLTLAAEPWLSCDDCFEQVDEYVERVLAGTSGQLPAMRAHLIGCAACGEEARSLLLLAAQDQGIDPAPGLRLLTGE
jgi:alkylation response protein AidB-like acyl-CoA dehydrogenase